MATVFSSLIRPPKPRRTSPSGHDTAIVSTTVGTHGLDEPNLRDLNVALQALTEIFPDVQPEVFREMLLSFSEESRLQVVTEALLKSGNKYIRGRYRMPAEQEDQRETAHKYKYRKEDKAQDTRGRPLATEETFRSSKYKHAATEALNQEFKGLSSSTVKAVLAEFNWSYTQARPTLLGLSSRSWRSSITNFLMRRKAPTAADHPLVLWAAADPRTNRARMPLLIKTSSDELNRELYASLIEPEMEKSRKEQIQTDFELAMQWNEEEAEQEGEMYDCECCFIPNTLQQMSTCDVDGHYICFRCIRHAINAALYDQGWARNININLCTLKCIAPMTTGTDECPGCIPLSLVKRALCEEHDGEDHFNKLNERFANESLNKSELPLIRCPFCSYAELDELALPGANLFENIRFKPGPMLVASVASISVFELLCYKLVQLIFFFFIFAYTAAAFLFHLPLVPPFREALRKLQLKRRGLRFQCHSPTCSRASCLACNLPWHDPHTCFSSQLTSLRLTLERATTDAVKRTCPQCNLGFVKSEGCNKLVCICGYSMCYICRQGLKDEGYTHFCGHFRDRPGQPCNECTKCDLYRVEDEERTLKRARERAEREWWDGQGEGAKEVLVKEVGKSKGFLGAPKGGWDAWIESALEQLLM